MAELPGTSTIDSLAEIAAQHLASAVVVVDSQGHVLWANPAAAQLLDGSGPDALLHNLAEDHVALQTRLSGDQVVITVDFALAGPAGTAAGLHRFHGVRSFADGGEVIVATITRVAVAVPPVAVFDDLTALPNRSTLLSDLDRRLSGDERTAVLFVDLDGFKLINDTLGHGSGDEVLLEVARRFRRAIRPRDLVARFGGDEFIVLTSGITSTSESMAIADRIQETLKTPVLADGRVINVTASIGVSVADADTAIADQLIGDADMAMYEAKALGRGRTVLFDAELRSQAAQRFDMTADLRHARRRRELRLEYQPIAELKTGEIVSAEALLRWDHPSHGRIMPTTFIPIAEEFGLIDDLGAWVIEQACADLDRLRLAGLVDQAFTMSVNVSANQLHSIDQLTELALEATSKCGLSPSALQIELTESVSLAEVPNAPALARRLTDAGFGLSIDDFGSGYSSLGYLTTVPLNILKIDQSLVADLKPGSPAMSVIEGLVSMGADMGFDLLAEGVEMASQRALLVAAGVRYGQGWLLGRPMPFTTLAQRLASSAA